jgi:hypothetical protein
MLLTQLKKLQSEGTGRLAPGSKQREQLLRDARIQREIFEQEDAYMMERLGAGDRGNLLNRKADELRDRIAQAQANEKAASRTEQRRENLQMNRGILQGRLDTMDQTGRMWKTWNDTKKAIAAIDEELESLNRTSGARVLQLQAESEALSKAGKHKDAAAKMREALLMLDDVKNIGQLQSDLLKTEQTQATIAQTRADTLARESMALEELAQRASGDRKGARGTANAFRLAELVEQYVGQGLGRREAIDLAGRRVDLERQNALLNTPPSVVASSIQRIGGGGTAYGVDRAAMLQEEQKNIQRNILTLLQNWGTANPESQLTIR